ncbi:hypothetical protein LPJ64_002701, partial [Coemansia asiatica]
MSKVNGQISMTIIADATGPRNRSHGMALTSFGFAPFATAAVFSLVLLLSESLYLFLFKLPETLDFRNRNNKLQLANSSDALIEDQSDRDPKQVLRCLNYVHFVYLFFFSGMEYTLTFLTHDKFDF